ncbi:Epoxide hydrolase A [Linum perenne]
MDSITHKTIPINNITMHIAEKGTKGNPIILFLHGFPELWFTWRHQILSLSTHNFHTVAPDLRGYGDTDSPIPSHEYTCHHIVGDIVALIDHLEADKVFLVAHDWGAIIGWHLCMFRPDKVRAFVCLSVPFRPRNPKDYYMVRFQEVGVVESEISRGGVGEVLKRILSNKRVGPPCYSKDDPFRLKEKCELPCWISEEEFGYTVGKFEEKGFVGGLNYYRALDLSWELTGAWTGAKVTVPVKYVTGDHDLVYTTPGMKEYVHDSSGFKRDVPLLEEIVVMEGVGHFINQERPNEINEHIYHFFKKFL